MTCIVGYVDKENDCVYIGADSAALAGLDKIIQKDMKVFRNRDFVIGCTSSFRMIQLLQYSLNPPEIGDKDIFQYMCTDFVNSVRECFKGGGYLQKGSEGDDKGGVFLVGYRDRLFSIYSDFQVQESINGMDACGCGEPYALAALYTIDFHQSNPERKVLHALNVASYFSAGVSEPFHVLCTKES